jgi:hypothetical protein
MILGINIQAFYPLELQVLMIENAVDLVFIENFALFHMRYSSLLVKVTE